MNDRLMQDAMLLHQAGNLADAARIYSDILRSDPRHLDALYRLGYIHLQNGRHADAEHLFGLAIKANPQVPEFFYARGAALKPLGRREEALAAFAQRWRSGRAISRRATTVASRFWKSGALPRRCPASTVS